MIKNITVKDVGNVEFRESFWSGKKRIFIDGREAVRRDRNLFLWEKDGVEHQIIITGTVFSGLCVVIDKLSYRLTEPLPWYSYVIVIGGALFCAIWMFTPALVELVPLVGGAIGGGIVGLFVAIQIYVARILQRWWTRVLVGLSLVAANYLSLMLIGFAFLGMFA